MLNPIITFVFIILIGLLFLVVTMNAVRVESFSGCSVGGTCSESLTEYYYNSGRPVYYGKLEIDSKEYLHSYCTLLPEKCK